ncbi:nucleotide exchange factor GrpE [Pseudohongiella sp.]|uniref:Protein GrpE n=1 Tax=marine sediment metagenome TaxID=412755 RepID=A0A0F9YQM2_9ZZZZ|nr:nucleotide exchange factor GrpE [Pseudohongiella sp.]HDZ10262.1 nucleotide exchange factor GrpE [Pseudohongiella sp.]HEA64242.1 nucleotide exchange factor GrpE [Pseudohongiella sp.]
MADQKTSEQEHKDQEAQAQEPGQQDAPEQKGNDSSNGVDIPVEDLTLEQALDRLQQAEAAAAGHQADILRLHADMQNVRRRAEQDVEKAHKYGQEKLVSDLLPVLDNLERALQAAEGDENEKLGALRQGVELTLKSFLDCLKKFNVDVIDPNGEPFNPQYHQAMGMQESATAEPDTVIAVMQKGYSLHGRVLRPAMVMVSRAPTEGVDVKA